MPATTDQTRRPQNGRHALAVGAPFAFATNGTAGPGFGGHDMRDLQIGAIGDRVSGMNHVSFEQLRTDDVRDADPG